MAGSLEGVKTRRLILLAAASVGKGRSYGRPHRHHEPHDGVGERGRERGLDEEAGFHVRRSRYGTADAWVITGPFYH